MGVKVGYKRSVNSRIRHQSRLTSPPRLAGMKLLLMLSLATLAMSQEAFVNDKLTESNDVPHATTILQAGPDSGLQSDNKKLDKRSHGWGGWSGYGHGWPSYSHGWSHGHGHGHYGGWSGDWGGWGGHGWYGGWYPGWPWWHGSSGWHGGHGYHGGWHGKW